MNQDLVMESVHGRKSKSQTTFKAVLNKVLVSALILGTVAGMSTPAFAASIGDDVKAARNESISIQNEVSVSSAISALRNTIASINQMKANGTVSSSQLQALASQLYQLEKSVKSSGSVTSDVITVINDAEKAISGVSGNAQAQVAVSTVKDSLGISSVTVSNKTAPNSALKSFDDVTADGPFKWAYTQIMAMAQAGHISGTRPVDANGVGSYAPAENVTVAQFVAIAVRSAYPDEVNAAPGGWSQQARQVAIAHNIIGRDSYQGDAYDAKITREEMTMIMMRCLESQGIETYANTDGVKSALVDFTDIGGMYKDYVAKAYTMGIMKGNGGGVFAPTGNATRAEAAVILYRCIDPSNREDASFETAVTPPTAETPAGQQKWVEGERHSEPKVGDIVIKDGKEIILKETYGILGAMQGVDFITGTVINGVTAEEGMNSWYDSRPFSKDEAGVEMHTSPEWIDLYDELYPDGLYGEYDGEVYNTWFKWNSADNEWDWTGGDFN